MGQMSEILGLVVAGGVLALAGWLFVLGNRVSVTEALLDEKWTEINRRLTRIERHVLNGHYIGDEEE